MRPLEALLDRLCVELGFCLPAPERDKILQVLPDGIDALAMFIWNSEGMGRPASLRDPLYRALHERIASFPTVGTTRLIGADGSVVALVDVAADCRPLEMPHVRGTFRPGPGFALVE